MQDIFYPTGDNFTERLHSVVMKQYGNNWNRLAKDAEILPSTLQNIKNGAEPKANTLEKIYKASGASINWFLSGDGPIYPALAELEKEQANKYPENHSKILINTDIKASAGDGLINKDEYWNEANVHNDWFMKIAKTRPSENHRIIAVRGHSMDSIYKDGDLILIDVSVKNFIGSGVYVFKQGESTLIKKLRQRLDGSIEVISANEEYPNYVLENSGKITFEYLAKVICQWQYEFV